MGEMVAMEGEITHQGATAVMEGMAEIMETAAETGMVVAIIMELVMGMVVVEHKTTPAPRRGWIQRDK